MRDSLDKLRQFVDSLNDRQNGKRLATVTLFGDGSFEVSTHDRSLLSGDSVPQLAELVSSESSKASIRRFF